MPYYLSYLSLTGILLAWPGAMQTGYYASLLDFIRTKKQNVSWIFIDDLMTIPM